MSFYIWILVTTCVIIVMINIAFAIGKIFTIICNTYKIRVVHCQSHLLDHCFHILNPLTSNYQSIQNCFQLHYLWFHVGQFLWEKILHLMFCWHFSQSLSKVCNTPCKPNHETGHINLDLCVKSVLLTQI